VPSFAAAKKGGVKKGDLDILGAAQIAEALAAAQTTLNVLVTLEDAFIAAYLVGVRDFSTPDLRVTAARIMGIESDHRTLARGVGPGVAAQDGGPIETVTGIQGKAESVDPPNNNAKAYANQTSLAAPPRQNERFANQAEDAWNGRGLITSVGRRL
jgi:hypothetical protein